MKKLLLIILIILIGIIILLNYTNVNRFFFLPRGEILEGRINITHTEIVADNLEIPWEIVFLPTSYENQILVSERSGRISIFENDWEKKDEMYIVDTEHVGEGGLLGMAIHPDFGENGWIYLYITSKSKEGLLNRVERYVYQNMSLTEKKIIVDNIPGAPYHDGGRIIFGPDKLLYISTGDARDPDSSQDVYSLSGKILRLTDEGEPVEDNPFGNEIFSYGHRNPQGLTFDDKGNLWSSEHGRSGVLSGFDEINIIKMGNNYGWPIIQGLESEEKMIAPLLQSGEDITWAPGDILWIKDTLFIPGLRGESLYEVKINEKNELGEIKSHIFKEFGRLRTAVLGPDENIYISTSNTDGRGNIRGGDDKIIKIKFN